MNNKELMQLISATATKTYNANIEYLISHHTKELKSIMDENGNVELSDTIRRTLTSYLRSAIELSTLNTLTVLEALGVEFPELHSEKSE